MKLFFIKSPVQIGYGISAGAIIDISDPNQADMFLRRRFAVKEPEGKWTPIPDDFPYKINFQNEGIISMEQLRSLPSYHTLGDGANYGMTFKKTAQILKEYDERTAKVTKKNVMY